MLNPPRICVSGATAHAIAVALVLLGISSFVVVAYVVRFATVCSAALPSALIISGSVNMMSPIFDSRPRQNSIRIELDLDNVFPMTPQR